MSITTKTGDTGMTSLIGGKRISKASLRVSAYGDIDELSSNLGLAAAYATSACPELASELHNIQRDLFLLAADFASNSPDHFRIGAEHIEHLEALSQKLEAQIPPQRCFLIPGGCLAAAQLHVARTVCRRAERQAIALQNEETVSAKGLVYLNRLSDYLYLAARTANHRSGIEDIKA
ncbi:MAG: cob(I)yrinic acid a,c-diamide adenosyltransferase [bacterium]|nr:cob(I)yrinic acid a,c-diamide adenosyltransferase [bacterium]